MNTTAERGMSNRKAVLALALLVIVLIGILAFALANTRNFMHLQYLECEDRLRFDMAANEAREVEVKELRELQRLMAGSHLDPKVALDTADSYERRAVSLEKAINAQVVLDCDRLRPPTLGDVISADRYVMGSGS